ncbi:uncharacterized protein LOC113852273 [Abrus precatorius]|uniref:Uncharacterized protein LOC113852273 n=1 Tax=Abrus precatorius TaxID=3816 RepID=A0A8B8K3S6_ABRPR|nr:uncharacterized protein LOC113852273 [Abrus precatorius]
MEERSQTADKSLAGTLMSTLTNMRFDGSRTMHEHVVEMTNIAARLKSLGMIVDESFLAHFILNSLPTEYGPFQVNYNAMKDKWNVHELHNMLVQEEIRLKNQGSHSVHYVSHKGHQGAGKKVVKKHDKGKGPLKINEASAQIQKNNDKDKCRFCGKSGHFQKNCLKRKAWFEKKGKLNAYGFHSIQAINPNERFMFMENRVKAPVEVVGTYRLILDTGHHLDLVETLYKSQAVDALEIYLNEVERQSDRRVKVVRSDRGGEYYERYDETGQHPGPFAKLLVVFVLNT